MKYPKNPLAQIIIEHCKAKYIQHIVISPGSRNAPLTIGFTKDSFFKCYSIVDERCAAFFGLGIAQQIKQPVALLCTSGSALLNYYPAIAEAYYSHIPLIVLSADRPDYLIGIGDGQTINQEHVFKNHIIYSANLKSGRLKENDIEINTAINNAIYQNGPVHINTPFEEPLYDLVNAISVNPTIIGTIEKSEVVEGDLLESLAFHWNNSKKKMIIVGVYPPNSIRESWIDKLGKDGSIIVFTETNSNLHHQDFFPCIDKIIAPLSNKELQKLQPDILLTFGGLIVSKKIKAFLRQLKPKHHWHIDKQHANDTFLSLNHHIKVNPNRFFNDFFQLTLNTVKSNFKNYWIRVRNQRETLHKSYLDLAPYSDLKVFELVLKYLPNNIILHLANSAAVRYAQLFHIDKSIHVYCNRGTSGIDGSTSTSLGCASVHKKSTILITGDLSFFYDSNALWNNYIPNNFRIILINNAGGGIFRILPGHKDTKMHDMFFETKHKLTAKYLSEMHGFHYLKANSLVSLTKALSEFYHDSKSPKLLEIFTPSTLNDKVLINYFEYIK